MDDIDDRIKNLQYEVNQLTNTNTTIKKESNPYKINTEALNSPIISYGILPCAILILLFAWKPRFIMDDITNKTNIIEKKLSYKKLIVATIVASVVVKTISVVALLVYKNKSRFTK
uniref:Uncharacterized protein n=1 Tax=viral metagenome TaxID=1070528 RepID=A0A6C0H344_9ZZZZ